MLQDLYTSSVGDGDGDGDGVQGTLCYYVTVKTWNYYDIVKLMT